MDGGGEHKQKKRRNQVKGASSSTYEVIARISLHPIPPPTTTIESCGKWIEAERDGKSIGDAWGGSDWWLLRLHDSRRRERVPSWVAVISSLLQEVQIQLWLTTKTY